nr:hypothetical protein [Morchella crassipes]
MLETHDEGGAASRAPTLARLGPKGHASVRFRPAQQPPRLVGPLPSFLSPLPCFTPPFQRSSIEDGLKGGPTSSGRGAPVITTCPRPSFSFEESKRRTGGAWTGSQHPSPPSMTFLPLIALRAINDPPSPPSDSRNRTGGEGGGPEERGGEPNSCKQLPLDPVLAPPSFYLSSKDKRRSACLRGAASTLVFFYIIKKIFARPGSAAPPPPSHSPPLPTVGSGGGGGGGKVGGGDSPPRAQRGGGAARTACRKAAPLGLFFPPGGGGGCEQMTLCGGGRGGGCVKVGGARHKNWKEGRAD